MRTIIIGDVHGMTEALVQLLNQVQPTAEDEIIFVGDLVDKGPDSAGVVRHVRLLSETHRVVLVLGNHEDAHARFRKHQLHRPETAQKMAQNKPYLPEITAELTAEDIAYLDTAVLFHRVPQHNILVVHAGIPGNMRSFPSTLDEASTWNSKRRKSFMNVIRTRYIDQHRGGMISLGEEKPGDPYWANVYDGRFGHVVFGHEAFLDGVTTFPHATGIDTGAVYGTGLTAMVIQSDGARAFVTVPTTKEAEPMIHD